MPQIGFKLIWGSLCSRFGIDQTWSGYYRGGYGASYAKIQKVV